MERRIAIATATAVVVALVSIAFAAAAVSGGGLLGFDHRSAPTPVSVDAVNAQVLQLFGWSGR